jgi:nucleotide-binding universal stress UspA family protein
MPYEHILVAVDLTEECDPVIHRARAVVSNGAQIVPGAYRRADGHGLWR